MNPRQAELLLLRSDGVTYDELAGVIVGDDDGFCFFWNTSDRIYIVAAAEMTEEQAVALADSIH